MLVWVCVVEKICWSSVSHVVWSPYSCLTSPGSLPNTTMPQGSRHKSFQTLRCPFQGCPKPFIVKLGAQIMSVLFTQGPTDIGRLFSQTLKSQHHQLPVAHCPSYPTLIPSQKTLRNQLSINLLLQDHLPLFHNAKCIILFLGCPCDENGNYLPLGTPPPPCPTAAPGDWNPFKDEVQFKVADFLYCQEEMLQGNINHLLELWALSLMKHSSVGPFDSYKDIYNRIDAIEEGNSYLSSQDPVIELNLTQGTLHGNVSRHCSMKRLMTQRRIGKNRNMRSGTVIQRWWLEICSQTQTSITSLTQHHMLS